MRLRDWKILPLVFLVVAAITGCSDNKIAGNSSQTGNAFGRISMADGSAAAGVNVLVINLGAG